MFSMSLAGAAPCTPLNMGAASTGLASSVAPQVSVIAAAARMNVLISFRLPLGGRR
jgi:hypothetical protein